MTLVSKIIGLKMRKVCSLLKLANNVLALNINLAITKLCETSKIYNSLLFEKLIKC